VNKGKCSLTRPDRTRRRLSGTLYGGTRSLPLAPVVRNAAMTGQLSGSRVPSENGLRDFGGDLRKG